MEGVIKRFMDEYTVVVEYLDRVSKKSEIMRVVDSEVGQIEVGDRVRFDLAKKDKFNRIVCRVVNKSEHDWF
ncbi:TPA: hypothetical protein NKS49_004505 [Vibrio parahaemolyticus]|nr:hypothetical protein [Vibrio parahaemolyticus]